MLKDIKKILVGVDDSDDAIKAFDFAIDIAREHDSELVIVSVLEDDDVSVYQALDKDYVHGEYNSLKAHMLDYKEKAENEGVKKVSTIISEGDPGETIIKDVISQIKPDLLVIGSLAKKGIARHFGSQAAYMAKHAPISVLVVR
ncbi:universal stress protein [Ligilactobacillus sp. WILCCON 0076]|uniref:Universal stress protein n=1 Tax=Ligilactobacillus ubinensis TaxID=2876789 RepID=A0A9X2FM15_9LACO|nr:universal stress protein [Ligilactobacillus ubinensis]MCP0886818.1 universal stress protein [Ligilactobacillus ubinensis]